MKKLETGERFGGLIDPDSNSGRQGIKEAGGIYIYEQDMPGWVGVIRREPKTGIWPFRRGTYDVSVTTLTGSWSLLDSNSKQIETPLIQNGRFRRIRSAVNEGLKLATLKKDELITAKNKARETGNIQQPRITRP